MKPLGSSRPTQPRDLSVTCWWMLELGSSFHQFLDRTCVVSLAILDQWSLSGATSSRSDNVTVTTRITKCGGTMAPARSRISGTQLARLVASSTQADLTRPRLGQGTWALS